MPEGVRIRRFLCPETSRPVSLLPDCLASHLPGTLADVGEVVCAVGHAPTRPRCARRCGGLPQGARRARAFLAARITLYPDHLDQLELSLDAIGAITGSEAV